MDKPENNSNWKKQYSMVALAGLLYIVLLGLFTWIFNNAL
jgi:hypothetical protein